MTEQMGRNKSILHGKRSPINNILTVLIVFHSLKSSPHYSAIRDGNQITIPENYLSKDYKAPGFRLSSLDSPLNPSNGKESAETQQ
ncbi:hypothetical protein FD723_34460 (plasmid) [Nostoc sp. C052]|uniref:hypothetical protein n=1 Tax=unclassified Nostoc TaxID=2593658 RepID=UPI00117C8A21|nr:MULTISPECIES: hypothetical protein [unclassified Nostoc]QLE45397.1 hypothetical protein FD723_34460 [Nostoc sp. C052]